MRKARVAQSGSPSGNAHLKQLYEIVGKLGKIVGMVKVYYFSVLPQQEASPSLQGRADLLRPHI